MSGFISLSLNLCMQTDIACLYHSTGLFTTNSSICYEWTHLQVSVWAKGEPTALVLLDLYAAFDTIDHSLCSDAYSLGLVLKLFTLYLIQSLF